MLHFRFATRLLMASLAGFSIALFQNCAGTKFSAESNPSFSPSGGGEGTGSIPAEPFSNTPLGLAGGHFDLDTSTQVYAASAGKTDHHVHAYDDKFNVTYADFFNLADAKLSNINAIVPQATRFVLIIANAQLSPKGVLSLNGQNQTVGEYQNKVAAFMAGNTAALPIFTLNGSSDQKLTGLRIGFAANSILNGGLIGTETSCVVANDLGKLGEYRNGALIIQAIDVSLLKLNPATKSADVNGGLLWESTLFYHWDNGCYK